MNMKKWMEALRAAPVKKAMPGAFLSVCSAYGNQRKGADFEQ